MKKPETPLALRLILLLSLLLGSVLLYRLPLSPQWQTVIQMLRISGLFAALLMLFEKTYPMEIYTKILLGLVLGAVAGLFVGAPIAEIKPVGTAFIRLIQMIVIPLVFASLLAGTASLGDPKKMGRIGLKTLAYYLSTTAFAIILGLLIANIMKPGIGLPEEVQSQLLQNYQAETGSKITGIAGNTNPISTFINIIPSNPFNALSQGTLLQIIFFAIFTGIALIMIPREKAAPVIAFFEGINDAMIQIVNMVIKLAPYGVFALIASTVGSFGTDILLSLLKYSLTTIFGMIILIFIYPQIVRLFTGIKPTHFMKNIRTVQLIAFSTSSSSATLPVNIEVCEEKLGVSKEITSFVLPLGATINMDGTAFYQGVSAIFIAQIYGISLGIGDQLIIILTATLASIGTVGVPGVGILMLIIVLKQVGIPLEGISLIMGVERILDMFRTVVNVTGDASAAVVVAASEGELKRVD